MSTVKSAGFRSPAPVPRGSDAPAAGLAAAQPALSPAARTAASAVRRAGRSAAGLIAGVRLRADDGEALVQLDVDLVTVAESDLDLVVALLVAAPGAGDPAAAGRRQSGGARVLERVAGDGDIGTLGGVRTSGRRRDPEPAGAENGHGSRYDGELPVDPHGDLLGWQWMS